MDSGTVNNTLPIGTAGANPDGAAAPDAVNPPEPVDAAGVVTVAKDRMKATICMSLPRHGGRTLSEEMIRALIREKGVVYGLRDLSIKQMGESPLYDRDISIAEGLPPQKGKDGSIEYHVRLQKDAAPRVNDDGSVDYKDLGLVENVAKDQLLVTKTPAEAGINGKDVLGGTINALSGKEKLLPMGKNTYISEDGLLLLASKNGQCDFVGNKLHVNETFTVRGDVCTATGNIDFFGNVIVAGSVFAGFMVKAGGNIDIQGHVEGSKLIAEGNVVIRNGFHGMNRGEIIAGGDVRSKYIQAGRVQAGGIIETQVILQANVQCSDSIKMVGSRSAIVGGRTMAKNLIECQSIGGKNTPVPTIIEVGSDPNIIERRREVEAEIASVSKSVFDLERLLQMLRQLEAQNRLTQDKHDMMLRSAYSHKVSAERLEALRAEDEEIAFLLSSEGYGNIIAHGSIYPGVRVMIGPEQKIIALQSDHVMLLRSDDGILERKLK